MTDSLLALDQGDRGDLFPQSAPAHLELP